MNMISLYAINRFRRYHNLCDIVGTVFPAARRTFQIDTAEFPGGLDTVSTVPRL